MARCALQGLLEQVQHDAGADQAGINFGIKFQVFNVNINGIEKIERDTSAAEGFATVEIIVILRHRYFKRQNLPPGGRFCCNPAAIGPR